ncbi:MAG: helix-turn-helix domain-containing protein [Propionibacteriaceae bacterium]|jgi:excisionase family DNA binding protein|nr:helix-turn-helix domain-containing protein [Propionibacteriaceae bacterium]
MMSVTIDPVEVTQSPLPKGDLGLPAWARTALEFISSAGRAGEAVSLVPDEITFSPAQVADQIGVSRASVQRRITAGEIRCRKVGSRYRIPLVEVERFRREFVREMATTLANDF